MTKAKCLVPTCSNANSIRGLCPTCYSQACRDIKKGLYNWDALISLNLATVSKSRGRTAKGDTKIGRAIAEAHAKQQEAAQ